jgi:hypothetical protein
MPLVDESLTSAIHQSAVDLVSGQGGNAVNGTGNGGTVDAGYVVGTSIDMRAGVHMRDDSVLIVGEGRGSLRISGGSAGGVDAGALTLVGRVVCDR